METINKIRFTKPPLRAELDLISALALDQYSKPNVVPSFIINGDGPYDIFYLDDLDLPIDEPPEPIWEIILIVYTKLEMDNLSKWDSILKSCQKSCEMNNLMSGGEDFGQNHSTHEIMDRITNVIHSRYQIPLY